MRAHEFISEAGLTFFGSKCTQQCQGHKAGYEWAKRKGATTPPMSTSPSFNKGAAIAMQQAQSGVNTISGGVRGARGRFQKFNPSK